GVCGMLAATVRSAIEPRRRAALLAIAAAALLPVIVTVIERPAMYNGIRHFVFVVPPLAVAGGLAGAWIALPLSRAAQIAVVAVFIGGIAVPAVGMARLHPYEYVYFNPIAGGVGAAQSRYMLDYWGLAMKQGGDALRGWVAAHGGTPPSGGQ